MGQEESGLVEMESSIIHQFPLKGVQRPAAFAIVCFCFCEFRTVSYFESCAEQVVEFAQSMLVFVLLLIVFQKCPFIMFQELLTHLMSFIFNLFIVWRVCGLLLIFVIGYIVFIQAR